MYVPRVSRCVVFVIFSLVVVLTPVGSSSGDEAVKIQAVAPQLLPPLQIGIDVVPYKDMNGMEGAMVTNDRFKRVLWIWTGGKWTQAGFSANNDVILKVNGAKVKNAQQVTNNLKPQWNTVQIWDPAKRDVSDYQVYIPEP